MKKIYKIEENEKEWFGFLVKKSLKFEILAKLIK
jgi:hypothetical protein